VEGFQKVRPGAPVQASEWKNGTPAPGGQAPAQPGAKPAESAPQPGAKPAEPAQQDKAAGQKS
jgi:membrane fusion protein (multidrug efflux system)